MSSEQYLRGQWWGVNLTDALQRVVEFARDFTGASHGALGVVRDDAGFSEYVEAGDMRPDRDPTGEQAIRQVVKHARTVRRKRPDTLLAVPVHTDAGVTGALCVWGRSDGGEFTRRDEDIAAAAASAAGGAIQKVGLLRRAARHEEWQAASITVCSALLAGEEPAAILQQIVESARRAAAAPGAAVLCPEEGSESLLRVDVVASDVDATSLIGFRVPVDDSAAGTAFETGEPVVARGVGERTVRERGPWDGRFPSMTKDLDSMVAAPLVVRGERLGVLAVSRFSDASPFSDEDAELVRRFASHAAMVVGYSKLEQDRRSRAVAEARRRIARDLHDVVVQPLYRTGVRVHELIRHSPEGEVRQGLVKIAEELDQAARDVRASISTLEESPGGRHSR